MALQTNLNEKDKKTIAWVLFAALIFVIAWFLIRPTVSAIRTTDDKIEQAEITRTQYQNKIMYLTSAEALYGKAVDDLNESTADYYEYHGQLRDRPYGNFICFEVRSFPESLIIKMPDGPVEERPYIYSKISEEHVLTLQQDTAANKRRCRYSSCPLHKCKKQC